MKFYKLNTFELQQELATDLKSGLSQSQAEERLKKDGPNFRMSNSVCHTKFRLLRSLLFILLAAAVDFLTAIFKRDINYVFYGITAAVFPIVCSCALHFLFKLAILLICHWLAPFIRYLLARYFNCQM